MDIVLTMIVLTVIFNIVTAVISIKIYKDIRSNLRELKKIKNILSTNSVR